MPTSYRLQNWHQMAMDQGPEGRLKGKSFSLNYFFARSLHGMLRNSVVFNVAGMLRGLKVPSRISFLCLSQCFLTPNFSTAAAASLTPAPI